MSIQKIREQIKDFEDIPVKENGKIDLDAWRRKLWYNQQIMLSHMDRQDIADEQRDIKLTKLDKKSTYGIIAFGGFVVISGLVAYKFWGIEAGAFVAFGSGSLKFVYNLFKGLISS